LNDQWPINVTATNSEKMPQHKEMRKTLRINKYFIFEQDNNFILLFSGKLFFSSVFLKVGFHDVTVGKF